MTWCGRNNWHGLEGLVLCFHFKGLYLNIAPLFDISYPVCGTIKKRGVIFFKEIFAPKLKECHHFKPFVSQNSSTPGAKTVPCHKVHVRPSFAWLLPTTHLTRRHKFLQEKEILNLTFGYCDLKASLCNFYQTCNIHILRCDFLYIHDEQVPGRLLTPMTITNVPKKWITIGHFSTRGPSCI